MLTSQTSRSYSTKTTLGSQRITVKSTCCHLFCYGQLSNIQKRTRKHLGQQQGLNLTVHIMLCADCVKNYLLEVLNV